MTRPATAGDPTPAAAASDGTPAAGDSTRVAAGGGPVAAGGDGPRPSTRRMHPGAVVVLDLVCVVAFIAVGQASHAGDGAATHPVLAVAPFLGALLVAHLVVRRGRGRVWPGGVVVWLITWGGGMAVRALLNDGVAPAFLAVGLGALGVLLLGWRAVATLTRRARARARAHAHARARAH